MTQPTVSKHWRKMFKDWASIPPSPPHRVTIIQHICSKTRQRKKYINTKESTHSEMGPVRQNPIQRTVRTAHLSVLMTVHNFQYTIQHRTVKYDAYIPRNILAVYTSKFSRYYHCIVYGSCTLRSDKHTGMNSSRGWSVCLASHLGFVSVSVCGLLTRDSLLS